MGVLLVPYDGTPEVLTSQCWWYLFAFPGIFIAVQLLLLLLVFWYDSPNYY